MIRQLVELLKDPNVESIELKKGLFSRTVRVSKRAAPNSGEARHVVVQADHVPAVSPTPPSAGSATAAPSAEPESAETALVAVKSPMVGTFYNAPEPGAEPYVSAGTRVQVGQVVCIIEAMKIMNEIEAETAGVIKELLIEDTQPVEFGQVLFKVDPNG